ncbi:GtrA family protein [Humibacter ginsenosidimutans]|uniref:GtrA family protein n=1 Tax=Humibacter ginsenosidimutans TaxID=2599293 RepID=A0A5B8M863_9MICO|nr:GtrA family protein [Humibacter ginsenosidimutans]QDZ16411.1 GtrA family protein [Humibacter ginsenosidimutans]
MRLIKYLYERFVRYALKFGVVGIVGYVVDVAIFNMLRLGATGSGHFFQSPLGAKIVSVAIATLVTWFGNRYWTFRENRRKNFLLELLEFTVIAIAGLGISLLCLWISHYVLGFTSLAADNISANVIGLVLATLFRFVMYRYWVYGNHRKDGLAARKEREAEAAAMAIFESSASASEDAASL